MSKKPRKLLEVKNLKKYFPLRTGRFGGETQTVKAVDDISFYINEGETLGLVGESGSGKTTVGRTILRALEPTSGDAYLRVDDDSDPVDIFALNYRQLKGFRRHMQMIFQDPYSSLNPRMTVRDIIAEPLIVNKMLSGDALNERVREVALRCKLNVEHLRRFPHAFSGGQRQRVGIARALVMQPKFIVCDESVSALDVSVQAEILNLLSDLQEEYGLTFLFIAHDLSVVEYISDRVAVLYLGRLVELAPSKDLFFNPLHPYTEALMSAIPAPDPDAVMKPIVLEGEIPSPINPPSGCHFHPRCLYAEDICKTTRPEWKEYQPEHFSACHLSDKLALVGASELSGDA
ncbi:MAG TPA: ATP-binding cassette domain-containing protein [Anaerolineae bacterium]|nr:ATP-binding cassette domain-containing protein [Anaerolineae bacterium]